MGYAIISIIKLDSMQLLHVPVDVNRDADIGLQLLHDYWPALTVPQEARVRS